MAKAKQPMTNIPAARKVAGVAEARHVVPHISPHADQRKIAAERNAQHNRDMARINRIGESRQEVVPPGAPGGSRGWSISFQPRSVRKK